MGIYLNPGNEMFQESLNSEIYVDKSGMIAHTNRVLKTNGKYLCVSRPRRFGKTTALDMLAAYYGRASDSRAQFAELAIANDVSFTEHLNRYDVIRIVMSDFLARSEGDVRALVSSLEMRVKREIVAAYPDVAIYDDDILVDVMARAYSDSRIPFVVLIDEWDCVMRELLGDEASQRFYLDWLRNLLKDRDSIALAYATGILPVKKYGEHSALNMFTEISILDAREYAAFTGFTEREVEALCARYGMDFDECRRWYDGYDVDGIASFNPRSVVMSMTGRRFGNYWTRTETYEALRRYIVLDMDGLREKVTNLIAGAEVAVNVNKSQNDMTTFNSADDVLTLLVHLGYLTYNRMAKTVRVPNSEVAAEFVTSIEDDPGWFEVVNAIVASDALMDATLAGDETAVADGIGRAHRENASVLRYNDENSMACVLSLAYYSARRIHVIEREAPAGKGFADLVFRPRPGTDAPGLVVELKRGASAEAAVMQIEERRYAEALAGIDEVVLVGVAYDPASKEYDCIIKRA